MIQILGLLCLVGLASACCTVDQWEAFEGFSVGASKEKQGSYTEVNCFFIGSHLPGYFTNVSDRVKWFITHASELRIRTASPELHICIEFEAAIVSAELDI